MIPHPPIKSQKKVAMKYEFWWIFSGFFCSIKKWHGKPATKNTFHKDINAFGTCRSDVFWPPDSPGSSCRGPKLRESTTETSSSRVRVVGSTTHLNIWGVPKMVGFPNNPMGFPTKNDQHLGCFRGTTI